MLDVSTHHDSIANPRPDQVASTENAIGFDLRQVATLDPAKRKRERPNLIAYVLYRTQDVTGAISLKATISLVPGSTLTYVRAIAAPTPSERGQIAAGVLSIAQLRNARRIHHHRDCPHLAQCLASASPEIRAAAVTAIGVHPDLVRVRS